jgi:hypothetical protein
LLYAAPALNYKESIDRVAMLPYPRTLLRCQ